MKSKIIEIVALGQPKSLIQRQNEPITELIDTNSLVEELNQALRLFAVSGSSANRCNECSKELENGTVFCSADCRQHYYH